MWKSSRLSFKSSVLRPAWILGFPEQHGRPERSFVAWPSRDLPPAFSFLSGESDRTRTLLPSCPSGEVSPARVRTCSSLWAGWCQPSSRRASAPGCLRKASGRVPPGNGVRLGLPLAFHSSLGSSVGKSSPRVVATADSALLFPQIPCAAWCRVSGRLKKKGK